MQVHGEDDRRRRKEKHQRYDEAKKPCPIKLAMNLGNTTALDGIAGGVSGNREKKTKN